MYIATYQTLVLVGKPYRLFIESIFIRKEAECDFLMYSFAISHHAIYSHNPHDLNIMRPTNNIEKPQPMQS